MTYTIKRSDGEIDAQRNAAAAGMDGGSKLAGMSAEEAVSQTIGWVTGEYDDAPLNPADYDDDDDDTEG